MKGFRVGFERENERKKLSRNRRSGEGFFGKKEPKNLHAFAIKGLRFARGGGDGEVFLEKKEQKTLLVWGIKGWGWGGGGGGGGEGARRNALWPIRGTKWPHPGCGGPGIFASPRLTGRRAKTFI